MLTRWIAGLGLFAALLGAQPGCAHQMTNRELALDAVFVGLLVGPAVISILTSNCDPQGLCTKRVSHNARAEIPANRADTAALDSPSASVFGPR